MSGDASEADALDALEKLLPMAEDWSAEMRRDKREHERAGFHSAKMDETDENAQRAISEARALLRAAGRLP
jgi:thiamine pyrophosphate-dependent acetolactate synthase large subunit-like protein